MSQERICVGAITGAFGVAGEVRLKSFCAEPTAIADYGPLSTKDGARSFTVKLTRPGSGGLGARLSGVKTKEEADALRGTELYVDRARLPKLPDDEFYHSDLIGLEVCNTHDRSLGHVLGLIETSANDVLRVGNGEDKDQNWKCNVVAIKL